MKYYHSGGPANNDPLLDLGGSISSFELTGAINDLFDNLTPAQSRTGMTDYRCFYITNDEAPLRNTKVYIQSQKSGGSYIEIGTTTNAEIQRITVTGTPNEDEIMVLSIDSNQFTVVYSINTTIWAKNFQNEIRGISGLNDVIITVSGEVPNVIFDINFLGQAVNKDWPLIAVINNQLTGTVLNVSEVQSGSPVNTTAVTIATKLQAPSGVNFEFRGPGNPIELSNLNTNDSFPLWVKRITPTNTLKKTIDNFVLKIVGSST